jgi:hypothetical protein
VLLIICVGLLLLAGFVTVATESFTNLLIGRSIWATLREFLLGSWLFALTACGWAMTVWLGLHWLGSPVGFGWVLEVLAFAHLPLLAYPLTIFPTIGYRLEQLLRMSVFAILAATLWWRCELSVSTAALLALPGWLAHFLCVELSLFRVGEDA